MSEKESPQANSKKSTRKKLLPADPPQSGRLHGISQQPHDSLLPPNTELHPVPMSDRRARMGIAEAALIDYIPPPLDPSQSLLSLTANAYNPLQSRVAMAVDDSDKEGLRETKTRDVMRKVKKLKQKNNKKYSQKLLSSKQSVVPKRTVKTVDHDLLVFPFSALATHSSLNGETESVSRALVNRIEHDGGTKKMQKLDSVLRLQPSFHFQESNGLSDDEQDDEEEDEKPEERDRKKKATTDEGNEEDGFLDSESDEETGREKDERTAFLENKADYPEMLLPFYHKFSIKDVPVEEAHKLEGIKRVDYARVNPNWDIPFVLSGGWNRDVQIHNYYTGAQVGRLSNTDTSDGSWSQCGEYFIVCGEGSVRIAEMRAGPTIVREFRTESTPVGARFEIKDNTAVIVLKSGTIHVYDDRLGDSEPVMSALGLPEITCIDTNPEDWRVMAIGFKLGAVKELNVLEPHMQSGQQTAYYQYFAEGMEGSVFGCFLDEELNRGRDESEVKSVRYCVSPDSRYYHDIVVTKANGRTKWNAGGDAAYKFSPGKKRSVISYKPPEGLNLSCATLAFNYKYDKAEDYVVAGTEEGVVIVFDAQSGKPIKGGTTLVEDVTLPDVEKAYFPTPYVPIRKDAEESTVDLQPATRITAIDAIPDMRLGSFIAGGCGNNPTIDVFRFQEEDDSDIDESLFHL